MIRVAPFLDNNTRRYPRTMSEAFKEWPESALELARPIQTRPNLIERLKRLMAGKQK